MICVLVVGSGAAWEQGALTALADRNDVAVLRRCVDVNDLLASATLGQADVALVGLEAPGLDGAAVEHLRRHGVRTVGVVEPHQTGGPDTVRARAARLGVRSLVPADDGPALVAAVLAPPDPTAVRRTPGPGQSPVAPPASPYRPADPTSTSTQAAAQLAPPGPHDQAPPDPAPETTATRRRVVAVWGPAGAPGRTTVATALAAALAHRGEPTLLVDADPWGGTVAQHLGVLDEVSGLLAVARHAGAGDLEERWLGTVRSLDRHLHVVTGLPRADRWAEVDAGALEQLVDLAREVGHVVLDTGFALDHDDGGFAVGPARNELTTTAVEIADEVVVVGTADPVGLTRLARGLADLRELGRGEVHVVVNRMRSTLGWSEREVTSMLADFVRPASLHFLPDDRAATDRALVTGRSLLDVGDGPLARAVTAAAAGVVPGAAVPVRRRRGGRARRR
ncbi:AAA family ATPase [Nocardioides sp. CPCC 205120]|uniref:AAA family ATPase n=1 Tax=Nocardioides sp. CPCC 205120 TaxID=3406462 RepID=UPI003B510680